MIEVIASPSVRKLAQEKGIDLKKWAQESGRSTFTRDDLEGEQSPVTDYNSCWDVDHSLHGPIKVESLSRLARLAAYNLTASNVLIPQVTHHDRADVSAIEALRKNWQAETRARGIKLTALAFHIKALALSLRKFPRFNASLSADGMNLILKAYIHIGIAVDTPHGLMVPVIRNADTKGVCEIASDMADLATRAQVRKIKADEMGGASITISNLGGIGGTSFTPIVNPPELAILGITRTETITVWDEKQIPRPVPMAPLDLSYDHRVINGADAARFLRYFAKLIAEPRYMLIE